VRQDLQSALTHELGHVLGLDHSDHPNATLLAQTSDGALQLRSLAQDDRDAICSAYPPAIDGPECAREHEEPPTVCVQVAALTRVRSGCAVGPPVRCPVFGGSALLALLLLALVGRRLRRLRPPATAEKINNNRGLRG
jgi:hypothetical protein